MRLEELFAGSTVDVPHMLQQLRQVARSLGLPFGDRTMTYNSRLAQELGMWADKKGRADAFHMEAFLAYFRDGRNLAKPDVVLTIADKAGLPQREARQVLQSRTFTGEVEAEWKESRQLGITAVPTLLFAGRAVTGFQPYDRLEDLIISGGGIPLP